MVHLEAFGDLPSGLGKDNPVSEFLFTVNAKRAIAVPVETVLPCQAMSRK